MTEHLLRRLQMNWLRRRGHQKNLVEESTAPHRLQRHVVHYQECLAVVVAATTAAPRLRLSEAAVVVLEVAAVEVVAKSHHLAVAMSIS